MCNTKYFTVDYLCNVAHTHVSVGLDNSPNFCQNSKVDDLELECLGVAPTDDGAVCLVFQESPEQIPEDWTFLFEGD